MIPGSINTAYKRVRKLVQIRVKGENTSYKHLRAQVMMLNVKINEGWSGVAVAELS